MKKYKFFNKNNLSVCENVMNDFPYVKEEFPNDENARKFIVSYNMSGGYYIFDEPKEFRQWISDTNRYPHFHEVILEGHQKMRFDIDVPYTCPKEIKNKNKMLENFLVAIKKAYDKYLRARMEEKFRYDGLVVMENHREGKLSWHIVMKEVWMRESGECLYFAKKVKELVSEEYARHLDLQVYKSMQCFRMEGHGKIPKEWRKGDEIPVLKQVDFEVKGRKYTHRSEWEDTLVSWYEGDCERLGGCAFLAERLMEKEAEKVKGITIVNKIDNGSGASLEILQKILKIVNPNNFEHKGGDWRVFSRCVFNIFGSSGCVKNAWLDWCEDYFANNEDENKRLWKSFKKRKARYGIPMLKKLAVENVRMGVKPREIDDLVTELCMDKKEEYVLPNTEVHVDMHGHLMVYQLNEAGVKKIVRLNRNRNLTKFYVSAMKAAAGGGYLLKSMLDEYYNIPEDGEVDNMIHETKPSVKGFYTIFKATVMKNRGEFDRVRSLSKETYEMYRNMKVEYERRVNTGEAAMESGRVVQVKKLEFLHKLDEIKEEVVYVRSPTGSGKTQAMLKYFTDNPEVSGVIVTQRVSLAEDMYVNFRKCGFEHYKYVNDFSKARRLIVQVESLYKLYASEEVMVPYDVMLMDESESLVSQFLSKNIRDPVVTRAMIKWLVEYSGKIVCMDAYMSSDTVRMVRSIKTGSYGEVMYVNETKTERGTLVNLVQYEEELVSRLMVDLKNGKRVALATNSVQKSKQFYVLVKSSEEYLGKKLDVALYNSDHNLEYWDDLKNVNENWVKRDVIIYTSSVETGVSFTKEHFDVMYGYFTPISTHYKSALQMLKRVRNLGDKMINLYIKPPSSVKKMGMSEGEYDELWEDTVGDYLKDIHFEMDRQGERIYRDKGPFYTLAMLNYQRNVESRNDFFNLMVYELERAGCYVQMTEDNMRTLDDIVKKRATPIHYKPMRENMLNPINGFLKKKAVQDIQNADLAEKILRSTEGGKKTSDAKTHLAIKKCLEIEERPTESQVEKYKSEGARKRLYRMKDLHGSVGVDYEKEMKKKHIENIRRNNKDMQADMVLWKHDSLVCLLAYQIILSKLWPWMKTEMFDLERAVKDPLMIEDISRVRENRQEDIDKISRVMGMQKCRMIKNIKCRKKTPDRKLISFINGILDDVYEIKLESNQQIRQRVRYKLVHNHPIDVLNKKLESDIDWDEFIVT